MVGLTPWGEARLRVANDPRPLKRYKCADAAPPQRSHSAAPKGLFGNLDGQAAFIDAYLKAFKPKNNRIDSAVSAAQGYDSVYLLAAAIKQANSTDGPKIREALENLHTKVDGVVTVYDKPFTHDDHDAITANIPVMGEVKAGRVVYAYADDLKKGADLRMKDAKAKAAPAARK